MIQVFGLFLICKFGALYFMVFVGILFGFDRGGKGRLLLGALSGIVMLLYGFQVTGSAGSAISESSYVRDFRASRLLT